MRRNWYNNNRDNNWNRGRWNNQEEFNNQRLSMTLDHCSYYVFDNIKQLFKKEDIEIKLYEDHHYDNIIKVTVGYCEIEELIKYDLDPISQLKNYRYYSLEDAVENQRRLLAEFRLFKKQLKTKIAKIKELIEQAKSLIDNAGQKQLECDIESYLEDNQLIIEKRVEEIKFDYIEQIKDNKIITNKKAIVNLDRAKELLKRFLAGENIINEYIGNFRILKVFEIKSIVFIRIGCHLIKIDKNLLNQLC